MNNGDVQTISELKDLLLEVREVFLATEHYDGALQYASYIGALCRLESQVQHPLCILSMRN